MKRTFQHSNRNKKKKHGFFARIIKEELKVVKNYVHNTTITWFFVILIKESIGDLIEKKGYY